jgi:hypothetical protein
MATTQDMRYEAQDERDSTRRSAWTWLLPLAVILLAAIALASYYANQNNNNGLNSGTTDTSF